MICSAECTETGEVSLRHIIPWTGDDSISTGASVCGIIRYYVITKRGFFMGKQKPEKVKKHICTGLLAHVGAGKTTITEQLLLLCGSIRSAGSVD